jgi:hypothetical protein
MEIYHTETEQPEAASRLTVGHSSDEGRLYIPPGYKKII